SMSETRWGCAAARTSGALASASARSSGPSRNRVSGSRATRPCASRASRTSRREPLETLRARASSLMPCGRPPEARARRTRAALSIAGTGRSAVLSAIRVRRIVRVCIRAAVAPLLDSARANGGRDPMPTIRLPEESEHGDMVKKVDAMIREISKATSMTPTTRALGLRPSILIGNHQELTHVMATRSLKNEQKRMIALAVAAVKAAPYELYAHTRGLQREYALDDGSIVELIATVAHVTSINVFEKAIGAFNDNAPMRAQDPSASILGEVRAKLGSVPRYFLYMATDPLYARIVLDREVSTVHEGEVSRLNKEIVAYATSVVNDGRMSMTYRAEALR